MVKAEVRGSCYAAAAAEGWLLGMGLKSAEEGFVPNLAGRMDLDEQADG